MTPDMDMGDPGPDSGPAERNQPHSLEAERAVLGAPMVSPSKLPEILAELETDDFFLPAHREIFDALRALDRREKPPEILLLADELQARGMLSRLDGGSSYLLRCANEMPTAENVGHYIAVVREKATLRRLIAAAAEIQSSAYGDFGEFSAFLAEASEKITAVALRRARVASFRAFADDIEAGLEEIQRRGTAAREGRVSGVRSGIAKLDRILGGLKPENVYVIAARPGVGKTSLAINFAVRHAAMGLNTVTGRRARSLIFELEMPRVQLVDRIFAGSVPMDASLISSGVGVQWNLLTGAASKLADFGIQIIDDQYTPAEIEATAHRYRSAHPDDDILMIVDYLQLADLPTVKGENGAAALGKFTKRLKRLAKKLRMPIVELSQLNRDVEKDGRRPKLSDLRESGAIEQDADAVIFIHDPGVKLEGDGAIVNTVDGTVELIVSKNRHGETGLLKVRWIAKYCSFYGLDADGHDSVHDAPPVDDDPRWP